MVSWQNGEDKSGMAALLKTVVAASVLLAAQMAGGVHAQTLEEFFKSRPFTIGICMVWK